MVDLWSLRQHVLVDVVNGSGGSEVGGGDYHSLSLSIMAGVASVSLFETPFKVGLGDIVVVFVPKLVVIIEAFFVFCLKNLIGFSTDR